MRTHQNTLIQLLLNIDLNFCSNKNTQAVFENKITLQIHYRSFFLNSCKTCEENFLKLNAEELAHSFVDISFMITAFKFIEEQHYLFAQKKQSDFLFNKFISKFFSKELLPILFFHSYLEKSSLDQVFTFKKQAVFLQRLILDRLQEFDLNELNIFGKNVIKILFEIFEFEYQLSLDKEEQNKKLEYSLVRTFDSLDVIFNLDYRSEMLNDVDTSQTERLFEGSGSSVQSSYASILLSLRYLKIRPGSRFIDLGSGFGRIGLVIGLLRPDIQFTGYEYVQNRVNMANSASTRLGISEHVRFFSQDLSLHSFLIPDAEIYYMYDPFCEKTYKVVMDQLNKIAERKKITIITKGNAKLPFLEEQNKKYWNGPQNFEHGHFCYITSKGAA